jgi:hypothetical protein
VDDGLGVEVGVGRRLFGDAALGRASGPSDDLEDCGQVVRDDGQFGVVRPFDAEDVDDVVVRTAQFDCRGDGIGVFVAICHRSLVTVDGIRIFRTLLSGILHSQGVRQLYPGRDSGTGAASRDDTVTRPGVVLEWRPRRNPLTRW